MFDSDRDGEITVQELGKVNNYRYKIETRIDERIDRKIDRKID